MRRFIFLFGVGAMASPPAIADYFNDQGLLEGRVRTDYLAPDMGTAGNPLVSDYPDCLWPPGTPDLIHPGCATGPLVYPASNFWQFNHPVHGHWLLLMNNEPWDIPGNSGPPNQSLPRSFPGFGVMGFSVTQRPFLEARQFHLALTHAWPNPQGEYAIPFLSIGAAGNRGNMADIGALNHPERPHVLEFTTRANLVYGSTEPIWVASYLMWATVVWDDIPRMLFLHLYHDGVTPDGDWEFSTPTIPGLNRKWNWAFPDSTLHPGADVAYMDAEDVVHHCGFALPDLPIRTTVSYVIDLQALYRCASDHGLFSTPMPDSGELPITGVHWANELLGDGVTVYTTVSNIRMQVPDGAPTDSPEPSIVTGWPDDDPDIEATLQRLEAVCLEHPACDVESGSPQAMAARQQARRDAAATGEPRQFRTIREWGQRLRAADDDD